MSNVESKNCVEELSCELSDIEKLDRSSKLARLYSQKMEIEDKKKAAMDEFKARLKKVEGEIHYLATILDSGKESRNVKCRVDYYWSEGNKVITRLDTGEIVSEEVISDYERQRHMDFVEKENEKRIKDAETQEWEDESTEEAEDIPGQEESGDEELPEEVIPHDAHDEDGVESEDQGELPLDEPEDNDDEYDGLVNEDFEEDLADEDDTPQCFGTYDQSDESCDNCVDAEKCEIATSDDEPESLGDDPDVPPNHQCSKCKGYFDEPGENQEDDSTFCPLCNDPNWM